MARKWNRSPNKKRRNCETCPEALTEEEYVMCSRCLEELLADVTPEVIEPDEDDEEYREIEEEEPEAEDEMD